MVSHEGELVLYTLGVIVIAAIGGIIPFLIKLIKNKTLAYRIIDVASVAASGLFLGGGIFHMLQEGIHYISDSGYDLGNYPLGYSLFGITFFLIFFVDRVIVPHNHAHFGEEEEEEGYAQLKENVGDEEKDKQTLLDHDHHHHHDEKTTKAQKLVSEWTGIVVLIVALAIHSFLEGLGLGSTEEPLMIFVAIAAHKWADSGLSILYLMKKIHTWWILVIFLVMFCLFTPLGTLIGYTVIANLEDASASTLTQGIFCCIAAGSFIFVAICEILCEGFEHASKYTFDKYLKFILAFVLFIGMSFTVLLEGDHHHHDH